MIISMQLMCSDLACYVLRFAAFLFESLKLETQPINMSHYEVVQKSETFGYLGTVIPRICDQSIVDCVGGARPRSWKNFARSLAGTPFA